MPVDTNLLDSAVGLLDLQQTDVQFLGAMAQPATYYVLESDRPWPGGQAKLLRRAALTESVLQECVFDPSLRHAWEDRLNTAPHLLPLLIVRPELGNVSPYAISPGYVLDAWRSPIEESAAAIKRYFDDHFARAPFVPVVDGEVTAPEMWPGLSVILQGGSLVGVFDEHALGHDLWRYGSFVAPLPSHGIRTGPPVSLRRSTDALPSIAGFAGRPEADQPPTASGADGLVSTPFIAHPRLTPESPAQAGQILHFRAGFADRPDADADEQRRIRIDDALPGETILVVVSADGAAIEGNAFAELALDLSDEHRFSAILGQGVTQVMLRAQYLFRNKLVGSIVKSLAVAPADLAPSEATGPVCVGASVGLETSLANPVAINPVDITLWVQKQHPGYVTWIARVSATGEIVGPFPRPLADTQRFAKALAGLRGTYGDTGNGARDELFVIGLSIAALIPAPIIERVLRPALAEGKSPPSIFLLTDEAYIPWELARLSPRQSGRAKPAFLGELACIGRWWTGTASSGPASQVNVEHLSAVAASQYGLSTNMQTLTYAIEERAALLATYKGKAEPVEARRGDIDAWLDREPRVPGHLAHIALHGYSDALADVQGLVLGDGAILTPNRLAGEWYQGQAPRFAMVFLNACQVGTGGERLGRMAGFPGALVGAGVSGFIAPLWEVQDEVALQISKDFYQRTLVGAVEVGEALRATRASTPAGGSITPWAYLFYGHPRLRLQLSPP